MVIEWHQDVDGSAFDQSAVRRSGVGEGSGTKDDPWRLKTPPQTSEYTIYEDDKDGCRVLVCTVGKTVLHYDARCLQDLRGFLKEKGDWVELGSADEHKPAKDGTVEAWGCSPSDPVDEVFDEGPGRRAGLEGDPDEHTTRQEGQGRLDGIRRQMGAQDCHHGARPLLPELLAQFVHRRISAGALEDPSEDPVQLPAGEVVGEVDQLSDQVSTQITGRLWVLRRAADLPDRSPNEVQARRPVRVDSRLGVARSTSDLGVGHRCPPLCQEERRGGVNDVAARPQNPRIDAVRLHLFHVDQPYPDNHTHRQLLNRVYTIDSADCIEESPVAGPVREEPERSNPARRLLGQRRPTHPCCGCRLAGSGRILIWLS